MKQLLATLGLVVLVPTLSARPPFKKALADLLHLPTASRLNDCRTCHLPGTDEDRPHNAFGERLKKVRAELKKAGKSFDITARLLAIADEDTDKDGVSNLLELLAGHFPSDATDRPNQEAIEQARQKQTELLASLTGYQWRPFDRVERPALPLVARRDWVRNPIDQFVAAEQESRQLVPRPEASRVMLLRRLYLDLLGVPPTPDEVKAFIEDASPLAYEKTVDRLLSSPHYGERWGRHWMDVWRYSDWAGWGEQVRDSQPHIWHWRDWIIESLNEDRPYDRMVQEMLAADELSPSDPKALRATGYLVRNYKLLSREKWMQDTVDHTAMAFLGVTLGCAKCHDHMYDPITQREYYQVRAIFTPHHVRTDRIPGVLDTRQNGIPRVFDQDLNAKTFVFTRGDDRLPEKEPLEPAVPESLGGKLLIQPIQLPREAYDPDRRDFVLREELAASERAVATARGKRDEEFRKVQWSLLLSPQPLSQIVSTAVERQRNATWWLAALDYELAEAKYRSLQATIAVEQTEKSSPEWETLAKAATRTQRQVALLEARKTAWLAKKDQRAKALTSLAQAEKEAQAADSVNFKPRDVKVYPTTSTGRRLAFARWITDRDNPLAARVAVNHIWQRHFGRGIVPGMFDFGKNGQPPSHPALLDWLAVELMDSGWSMKHVHRLIVTSATYRQASTPTPENLARDPDNVYLWRFTPRRLEAETVRDAIFHVAGALDRSMFGPDIPHAKGLSVPRRSIYFQHAQEKQMEFLQIFDVASVTECYVRRQAILPQQALALVNSDLVLSRSKEVARQLGGDDPAFIEAAFLRVLSRTPSPEEQTTCLEFLRARGERGRENLVHVLYNHHEFATLR